MITPTYEPGQWTGLIAPGCVALLPPKTDNAIIKRLWESMLDGEDLMSQLMVITDGQFSGLGAFAIAQIEGNQVHMMLRGDIDLTIGTANGEQHYSAQAVSTWLEQIVDDAASLTLRAPQDGAVENPAAGLPLASGVAFASQIAIELVASGRAKEKSQKIATAVVPEVTEPADAVPNKISRETVPPPVAHEPVPPPPVSSGLWQDAAEEEEPETGPVANHEDHDGMTIMNSEVVAMRQQLPAWEGDAVPGPLVDPADSSAVPKIVLSTGMAVALDRPILLGRAPQVSRVKNDEMPRLITVDSPNHDISRTHAEVRMDGAKILVTDLTSTNGVLLTRPGAVAERLEPGTATAVEAGAVVDLGEGVTFVVGRQS